MNLSSNPAEKLILALDGMNEEEVFSLISKLPDLIWVKVGLELFTLTGPEILVKLKNDGKKVFLDLKFHDIPSTMSRACYRAAMTGAELITVHACAGSKALSDSNKAAHEGASKVNLPAPKLLAVTVLTSWSANAFEDQLGISQPLSERVAMLSQLASKAGISGCVCSPQEVSHLRVTLPKPFELVTPGIRSLNVDLNDQVRVMTPSQALNAGASRLVVGRSITKDPQPLEAFQRICNEIETI